MLEAGGEATLRWLPMQTCCGVTAHQPTSSV